MGAEGFSSKIQKIMDEVAEPAPLPEGVAPEPPAGFPEPQPPMEPIYLGFENGRFV